MLFKCKICGADLDINEGVSIAKCKYCDTTQTVPKAKDENLQNLFNRANTLRIKSEFDKAEKLYERIVQADFEQSEAYWGLILCKYGIEYVDDPITFKKIPTCHRTSYDSIIADDDYKSALLYADHEQRPIYEEQAKEIDRIQKEILALAQKEETYDVFICYKETDSDGRRTQDSVIANDIYYQLTQEGFKVFYAAITLEDKLGSAYEPIIFAALSSSKVMLSIGTKPEYFNAVWVKNEWSRFLKMIKKDRSKMLIPCYRDMDAYELPEEFAHLQAQDMSKIGFINDIVRGIKKVVSKDEPKSTVLKETVVKETVVTSGNSNTKPLLQRAFIFLEDKEWKNAEEYCEKVLDMDPQNAGAYLGKLMAELKVPTQEKLKEQAKPFDDNGNYQRAVRFADEKLKSTLIGYIEHINTRNENARMDGIYTRAKSAMSSANTENDYKEAACLFESIDEYKDSATLAKECYEEAETARKDAIYSNAASKASVISIESLKNAIQLFQSIPGWKDADEQIAKFQPILRELKAKEANERIERERKAEQERIEALKRAKRNKKIAIITAPIVCAIIAFIILLNNVIFPSIKYNKAIALMDAGNIVEAYEALIALDGYKDSADKANAIYDNYRFEKNIEKLKTAKVGDYVFFGAYEQDNNSSNGKEDVEWLVLEVKDGKALVISKYALDCQPYNISNTSVTWETCTLRKWLNNDFINSAFTADEKALIPTVTVSADKNPDCNTTPGNATLDRVFLLSITEASKYFSSNSARQCKPTEYAIVGGAYVNSSSNCRWWLRSPGLYQYYATIVITNGDVRTVGIPIFYDYFAVRPAMWIDIPN